MKKRAVQCAALLMTMVMFFSMTPGMAYAAQSKSVFGAKNGLSVSKDIKTKRTYTEILSVKKIADVYSDWMRKSEVTSAGKRGGGTGGYFEGDKVTVKGKIGASIPIRALKLELGGSVERSITQSLRAESSDRLKPYESCAYYYREHLIKYAVKQRTVTETLVNGRVTSTKYSQYRTSTIEVPKKLTSKDYGWFYAERGCEKQLKAKISKKFEKEHTFTK